MQKRLMVLIVFIAIFAVFLIFIMLNLGDNNKCDINLGFTTLEGIPIFLSMSVSFILGLICAIPLVLQFEKKSKGFMPKIFKSKKDDGPSDGSVDALSAREKFIAKRRDGNDT